MLGAEVLEPLDHRVAADHPRADPLAVLVGAMPEPRLRDVNGWQIAGLDLSRVAGQQQLDLAGEPADRDHVVPVPGRVGRADHEHAGLPEDQERVAALAGQRVGLDPPPIPRQRREPALELGDGELEPPVEVDVAAQRLERLADKRAARLESDGLGGGAASAGSAPDARGVVGDREPGRLGRAVPRHPQRRRIRVRTPTPRLPRTRGPDV